MSDPTRCERCDSPLPEGSGLGARCPRCMIELGLESTSGFGESEVPSAERARASLAAPPSVVGRYRILRLIGEGGMGSVYEAEQEHPRRTVALKIIKPGTSNAELLRRFEQE